MSFFSPATALGPLAFYLIWLGLVNLSLRPRVLSGVADSAALCLGISGLVIVGPLQILLPQNAMIRFGDHVWYPSLLLYLFGATWLLLLSRPRLIIYNIRNDVIYELLENIFTRNRWAVNRRGNILHVSEVGLEVEIVSFAKLKNVTLRPIRAEAPYAGWRALRKELSSELRKHHGGYNNVGVVMIFIGLVVGAIGCAYI